MSASHGAGADRFPRSVSAQGQSWPGVTDEMRPVPDHGEETYVGRDRLPGKKALITGGDSGIGRAVAIAFAKEGASVAISYLPQEQADAEQTSAAIEAAGGTCALLPGDLRTERANEELAAAAVEALGGVDVVVANAGFQMAHTGGITDFPSGQIEQVFETNVFAAFWLVKALAPRLGQGSSVIITTSIQAFDPSEPLLDYAATKAALNNLMVNLASTMGPDGVRVNAVAPGPIWTPLIVSTFDAKKVEGFGKDTPLGRPGQPVELAPAYVFLASDEASYVSGTVLGVTGGRPVF